MTLFYIDTSTNYLFSGIVKDSELLVSKKLNLSHDLSTFAIDEVAKMFDEINFDVKDIDKIIVVSGPGSFTGIRIGMALAKVYAYCLNKEITTITSLEAMNASVEYDGLVVPIIDARRGYVYAGIYDDNKEIIPNQYIALEKLKRILDDLGKDYVFISNDKIKDLEIKEYNPDILKIVLKYQNKAGINPHLVEPTYFKLTEAEENLRKDL